MFSAGCRTSSCFSPTGTSPPLPFSSSSLVSQCVSDTSSTSQLDWGSNSIWKGFREESLDHTGTYHFRIEQEDAICLSVYPSVWWLLLTVHHSAVKYWILIGQKLVVYFLLCKTAFELFSFWRWMIVKYTVLQKSLKSHITPFLYIFLGKWVNKYSDLF